jgi:RsiW-degrading membrane proteinase PrsW (M82 family)
MPQSRWPFPSARALFGAKLIVVPSLVAFALLVRLVELVAGLRDAVQLGPILALVMAAIPGALWLVFFSVTDRREDTPKRYVVGLCALGALVAAPVAAFLIELIAPPVSLAQHGLSPFSPDRIVYAVAIVGLTQELCKYAIVRYTIYLSPEFDQPIDGVIYMTAAGAGFAIWVNYHRLSGQDHHVFLSVGAAQAVITTFAHASFAGALGYVLGKTKFSPLSAPARGLLVMGGLLGAAVLNGQFALVEAWLRSQPWKAIGYAAAMISVVFIVLMLLMGRLARQTPARRRR